MGLPANGPDSGGTRRVSRALVMRKHNPSLPSFEFPHLPYPRSATLAAIFRGATNDLLHRRPRPIHRRARRRRADGTSPPSAPRPVAAWCRGYRYASILEHRLRPGRTRIALAGKSANETLAELLAADPGRETRQVAIIAAKGQPAAHTGAECIRFAGISSPRTSPCRRTSWEATRCLPRWRRRSAQPRATSANASSPPSMPPSAKAATSVVCSPRPCLSVMPMPAPCPGHGSISA